MTELPPRRSLPPEDAPSDLRALCRRELPAATDRPASASVSRVVVEVRLGARTELVTLGGEGGRLVVTATDGGATSPAARAAVAWLAGELPMRGGQANDAGSEPDRVLGERLDELVAAVARSGLGEDGPPAVRDALERLVATLSSPLPAASRWLARLGAAVAESDARQVARLASVALARDPQQAEPFASHPRPLSDRRFLELARESVEAWGPAPLERRVLLDLEDGELLTESRHGAVRPASVGPCPRLVELGFGTASGAHPADLQAQQYTVSTSIPDELWERVEAHAVPMARAGAAALAALTAAPATAEPLSLVHGPILEDGVLLDESGARLPLSGEDPGAVEVLRALAAREPLRWVVLRWASRDGGLSAVPLAAGHRRGRGWVHVRLR
jgi:hypothetical protein